MYLFEKHTLVRDSQVESSRGEGGFGQVEPRQVKSSRSRREVRGGGLEEGRGSGGAPGRPSVALQLQWGPPGWAEQPRRRYWCGLDAYLLFRPLSLAPDWIVDRINVAALP